LRQLVLVALLAACGEAAVQDAEPDVAGAEDTTPDVAEDGGGDAAMTDLSRKDTWDVRNCNSENAKICDDGIECTRDLCLEDGACANPLRAGWCYIDEECLEDGDLHPDADCLECITAVAVDSWTPDDTNGCKDGDPCTLSDRCVEGVCLGTLMTCPPDGNPCTAVHCESGSCATEFVDGPCNDGDPCTEDDVCVQGGCVSGDAVVCDDGNACTDDSCIPGAGCLFASNTAPCDDGNACTTGDACGGAACQAGTQSPDCDDGNPCTDDSCHPVNGQP